MQSDLIQAQIANHFIKKGKLLKQSRYLKVWSERYLVLTQNYIFTFKTQQYIQPADVVNLSYFVSIKSSAPSLTDGNINDFTIETTVCNINFRCENSPDKWNWIVAIERLLDLRVKGDSYYNTLGCVMKKGFDSVNDFALSYPDGPGGKYVGSQLIKLCKSVQKVAENIVKEEKQNEENEKKFLNALSEQRKKVQLFDALGVGDYAPNVQKSDETNEDQNNKNQEQGQLRQSFDLSSLFQGRSHETTKKQKQEQSKSDQNQQTFEETVMIDGQMFKKVIRIKHIPIQGNFNNEKLACQRRKSNIEELEVIPKGKVNEIAKIFEHKIQENLKEQEQMKRRDSLLSANIQPEQIKRIRKSRIAVGAFDEFEDSQSPKKLAIYLEFIVNLMCEESCDFRDYIKFQSLNHNKRNNFTELFLEYYLSKTDQQSIHKMLKFFSLIFPDCPSLFTESQLLELKGAFFNHLTANDQDIHSLSLNNLDKIRSKVMFTEQEIEFLDKKRYVDIEPLGKDTEDRVNPQNLNIDEPVSE